MSVAGRNTTSFAGNTKGAASRGCYKQRQLAFCDAILSHGVFADTLKAYFETGVLPQISGIVQIMKKWKLYNVNSESTYRRRASTIRSWINWIVGRIND